MLAAAVAGVVLLAIFLSGPIYELLIGWELLKVDPNDPDRTFLKVIRRVLLVPLGLVLAIWLRPWRDGNGEVYGLRGPKAAWRPAATAYLLTWVAGVVVLAAQLGAGWIKWEVPLDFGDLAGRLAKYVPLGLLIAFLEEWFFRGWLWRRLGHGARSLGAAIGTSLIYAGAHAFRPGVLEREVTPDAAGAAEALAGWLRHATDVSAFGPRFLGLFLFGMLLAALYRRRGNLWSAIAVHAAGVALLQSYGALTERVVRGGWGGGRVLLDGAPVWIGLALLTLLLWRRGAGSGVPGDSSEPRTDRNS